jgi:hypothetical protein
MSDRTATVIRKGILRIEGHRVTLELTCSVLGTVTVSLFVRVPPDVISFQLLTLKAVAV